MQAWTKARLSAKRKPTSLMGAISLTGEQGLDVFDHQ
jgi:hypothetical protein